MTTASARPETSPPHPASAGVLTRRGRALVLAAAFLAWMFAGLELSMFALAGRPAIIGLLTEQSSGIAPAGARVGQWFTWYQGAIMLGAAAGGWGFGWLGDRFGRTRSMAWAIVCYSVMTGLSYFVTDPTQLLFLRFAVGMGIGGVWPNAVSLVAEAWPNASRPFLAGLLGTAANFGFVLLAALALYWLITPDSWRWVPLLGTAPVLIGLWVLLAVPESPKWLAGRAAAVAATAGGSRDPDAVNPMSEVLRPPLLSRTMIGILLGAIPVIGTAANGNWVTFWSNDATERAAKAKAQQATAAASTQAVATTQPVAKAGSDKSIVSRKTAITQIQRSGGGIFGSLLGGWIASLLGRRLTYFFISLVAFAISSVIFGLTTPDHPYFGVLTVALGFVGVCYFGWLPLYLPELYPTRVRSTGTGITFNSGRVLAAVATLGASVLVAHYSGAGSDGGDAVARVGLATGRVYAVGMLIICFAPSTGKKKLED